jgi:hypothetical protein
MTHIYEKWCDLKFRDVAPQRRLHLLRELDGARAAVKQQIIQTVQSHYDNPTLLAARIARLGMVEAARVLAEKMPQTKKGRSAHLGEILATEVVPAIFPQFQIPIKRLRWNDGRETSMRGEDLIGISIIAGRVRFLKGESKSRARLTPSVVAQARRALNANGGSLSVHAMGFIASRLAEMGNEAMAAHFEEYLVDKNLPDNALVHLNFAFSGNDAQTAMENDLRDYRGRIEQHGLNLIIADHQNFILTVYTT